MEKLLLLILIAMTVGWLIGAVGWLWFGFLSPEFFEDDLK
jgi:hypothetical protein